MSYDEDSQAKDVVSTRLDPFASVLILSFSGEKNDCLRGGAEVRFALGTAASKDAEDNLCGAVGGKVE
jgi:hypothetical protein